MTRFELIQPILAKYQRPITVLDFGAGIDAELTLQISRMPNVTVIAVEKDEIRHPLRPNVVWLRHDFTAEEIVSFAYCEHFDVVLGLNILHHFGADDWKDVAEYLLSMCDVAVFQTPYPSDKGACGENNKEIFEWLAENGEDIGETVQFPGHMPRAIFKVTGNEEPYLSMTTVFDSFGNRQKPCIYELNILSTASEKNCFKPWEDVTPWVHGMNLWNFCHLGGAWPTKERVLEMLRNFPLPAINHGDIAPWNFILDGEALHLIDGYDGKMDAPDAENLAETIKRVEASLS